MNEELPGIGIVTISDQKIEAVMASEAEKQRVANMSVPEFFNHKEDENLAEEMGISLEVLRKIAEGVVR